MRLFEHGKYMLIVAGVLVLMVCAPLAWGEEDRPPAKEFDGIEALIRILQDKGVITSQEAQTFIRRYKKVPLQRQQSKNVIMIIPEEQEKRVAERVSEGLGEKVQGEIESLEKEMDAKTEDLFRRSTENKRNLQVLETKVYEDLANKVYKSSWAQRIRWGGDVRVRYQGDFFDETNALIDRPDEPAKTLNTTNDRQRGRYRVRLALKADIVDSRSSEVNVGKAEVGIRLATGNETDPISTNETFGDFQNKDDIVFDRAYLKWTYQPWEMVWGGKIPELSIIGGRIPNPWFSTDLVWDSDLNFEGIALNHKTDTLASNPWRGFVTLGAFSIQEEQLSQNDKWLFAGQVGVERRKAMGLSAKLGVAYYEYRNMVGEQNISSDPNAKDFTAPLFQTKGNTLMDIDPTTGEKFAYASDFELVNVTGQLDYDYWYPTHIVLTADYVRNLGFDREEIALRVDPTGDTEVPSGLDKGYQVGLTVGYPKIRAFGEWNVSFFYKYLEGDAVVDAFSDSDFHLGGTNAQGWTLGGALGLYQDVWLKLRWLTSDEIDGPPIAVDTLHVDVNARF